MLCIEGVSVRPQKRGRILGATPYFLRLPHYHSAVEARVVSVVGNCAAQSARTLAEMRPLFLWVTLVPSAGGKLIAPPLNFDF
jgi:hypothetical protein